MCNCTNITNMRSIVFTLALLLLSSFRVENEVIAFSFSRSIQRQNNKSSPQYFQLSKNLFPPISVNYFTGKKPTIIELADDDDDVWDDGEVPWVFNDTNKSIDTNVTRTYDSILLKPITIALMLLA